MRVKVTNPRSVGGYEFGEFVGLVLPEEDGLEVLAAIRVDGFGLMLKLVHPSTVTPTTKDEEADYKP